LDQVAAIGVVVGAIWSTASRESTNRQPAAIPAIDYLAVGVWFSSPLASGLSPWQILTGITSAAAKTNHGNSR
jgi:hypothetical protein